MTQIHKRYVCLRCGRNKFNHPQKHNCRGQFVKRLGRAARILGVPNLFIEIDPSIIKEEDEHVEQTRDTCASKRTKAFTRIEPQIDLRR